MRNQFSKLLLVLVIGSVLLMGCSPAATEAPVVPTEEPVVVQPTEMPTEAPTVAPTEAPTEIPTVAPTEIPTVEATQAPAADAAAATPAPAATDTAAVVGNSTGVTVVSKQSVNCRKYPMRNSNVLSFLAADKTVEVHGKDSTSAWFYIANPVDGSGRGCWVWGGSATVTGDLESVPVVPNSVND